MQHHDEHSDPEHPGEILPLSSPLDHSVVLRGLWPGLATDDRRALRQCSTAMRDAVDAQAGVLEGQDNKSPVLSPDAVARLAGVHTLTLRTMACLRGMLVSPPHPGAFPHLQSLRLHLVGAHAWQAAQLPCTRNHHASA
jgi:hypothetical protein